MRVLPRLTKSRSSSSASQQALPSRSVGRRRNPVLTAVGFLILGQACFSEWSLIASFSGCSSILTFLLPFLLTISLDMPSLTFAASAGLSGVVPSLISWMSRPHASLRVKLVQPRDRGGNLAAQRYRQRTPAMASGRTNRRWTAREVLTCPLHWFPLKSDDRQVQC